MSTEFLIILILLICTGIQSFLLIRQRNCLTNSFNEIDNNARHALIKLYFIGLAWLLNCLLVVIVIFSGLVPMFIKLILSHALLEVYIALFSLVIIQYILHIVIALWQSSFLDKKMLINRSTYRTALQEFLKKSLVSVIFFQIWLLAIFVISIIQIKHNWLMAWGVTLLCYFLYEVINPIVLYQLFNKTTQAVSFETSNQFISLLKRHRQPINILYRLPTSKNTWQINAGAVGFGRNKRIIFCDALFNMLPENQMLAIFIHELGHIVNKDLIKQVFLLFVLITMLFLLGYIIFSGNLFFAISTYVLCGFVVQFLAQPVISYFRRQSEFAADAFAKKEGYGDELIKAITMLNQHNMTLITPDPWFMFWYYTHPPLSERIAALKD